MSQPRSAGCSMAECDRPFYALTFCERHYRQKYTRQWRDENRERMNATRREHYAKNREANLAKQKAYRDRVKAEGRSLVDPTAQRRSKMLSRYGITEHDYDALFQAQGSSCAICRASDPVGGWVIDHCHDTGTVRGILCRRCNSGLGQFRDDPDRVAAALSYLTATRAIQECA